MNKLLFWIIFYFLISSCSSASNAKLQKERNYNPYSSPNYKNNSYNRSESNSNLYQNPYNLPNVYQQGYQQSEVYDYDQYYIAPMQYNNVEPERKSVIHNKY